MLDAYKIEQAHIVGMSLGGMIAQIVALKHPQRVQTLTLMMTSIYGLTTMICPQWMKKYSLTMLRELRLIGQMNKRFHALLKGDDSYDGMLKEINVPTLVIHGTEDIILHGLSHA